MSDEELEEEKEGKDETRKLGCGEAYKGGRCATGDDVSNCIFRDYHDP